MRLLDNGSLLLDEREFRALPNYTLTLPTGKTPGKAWRRKLPDGSWLRGVYGQPFPSDHKYAGQIPIGWRPIVIAGRPAEFPVWVEAPGMKGLPTSIEWPPAPPPPELPEGVFDDGEGNFYFSCRGCDASVKLEIDPEDFDPDVAYCGGSPWCLP